VRQELLEYLPRNHDNCGEDNAHCELCNGAVCENKGLFFAHRMKRRKMPHPKRDLEAHIAELRIAAYIGQECHIKLEHGPPDIMYDTITEIVERRSGEL
jgi:hypothetical protein